MILSFISNQPRKGNRTSGAAIDCDYACHLLVNYISKARLIFKKITDANKMGIPGSRCKLIFFSRIADTRPKPNTTIRWVARNAKIKISLGHIRQTVMALTASAPPHHFNSHAAQKPMIATEDECCGHPASTQRTSSLLFYDMASMRLLVLHNIIQEMSLCYFRTISPIY